VRRVFDQIGLLQIDSVNVLVRSQELPLFARIGPHPRDVLPRMTEAGELFEYWGHEASLLPVDVQPLFRWRMRRAEEGHAWRRLVELKRDRPDFVDAVLREVHAQGPIPASALDDGQARGGPWWGWKDHKVALEMLFWIGAISARRRGASFERVYDLTDRMLPAHVLAQPTPSEREANKELLRRAVGHLGVATARDAADYFRLRVPDARPLLVELVDDGALRAAQVEGWRDPAYLDPTASMPRRVDARALLSPFDSLVWERDRTERIFGFRYRLELYTPAPKRVYGYYVLPFLLGDALVARVDLKADRAAGVLRVQGAFAEADANPRDIAGPLMAELSSLAEWLGLDGVVVTEPHRGETASALARLISRQRAGRPNPPTSA
jgi:uncharacterized protein YcaQ